MVYHPAQDVVYFAWAGTSEVRAHDANTLAQIAAYDVGYSFNYTGNAFTQGRLRIARDGSVLFVTVGGGVRCIWLTRAAPTSTPTSVPTKTPVPPTTTPTSVPTKTPVPPTSIPTATPVRIIADYGVTIDDEALFTNQVTVTLTMIASADTREMQISGDGGFKQAVWEPYRPTREWQLTRYGNYAIPRTVYVRFKDAQGIIWGTFQDDILLDETSPRGQGFIIGLDGSKGTIALDATDDGSGVQGMRLGSRSDFANNSWETYTTKRSWSFVDTNAVYIQFRDNAGNVSQPIVLRREQVFIPFAR